MAQEKKEESEKLFDICEKIRSHDLKSAEEQVIVLRNSLSENEAFNASIWKSLILSKFPVEGGVLSKVCTMVAKMGTFSNFFPYRIWSWIMRKLEF